jgi:hypothetical protein
VEVERTCVVVAGDITRRKTSHSLDEGIEALAERACMSSAGVDSESGLAVANLEVN